MGVYLKVLKFKRILIPVDFSKRSARAIEHGVNVAKHFNAETIFLHAVAGAPYETAFASSLPGGLLWTPGPELEASLRQRLDQLVEEVAPGQPGERLVVNGGAGHTITETVGRLGVDLIVMPTSGAGRFRRFLLGSATATVLNDTDCPVLTGPHTEDIDAFALQPFRRVGCAVDLDQSSERVVQAAADMAAAYRADVIAIHALPTLAVGGEGAFGTPEMSKMARTHARAHIAEKLKALEKQPEVVIEQGQPDDVVPRAAKQHGVDLLVIGRHGEGGILSGLQTHAYGIIRAAECPVLSV